MQRLLRNVLNPFVVLTMIAIVSAIATFLPYSLVHQRITYTACAIVAVLGISCVAYQMWSQYHLENTKTAISRLLAEGEQITLSIVTNSPDARQYPKDYPSDTVDSHENYVLMVDWCKRVENVLRKQDESYVTRFHLGGSIEQDKRSMIIWKARHRLETLASFLAEIK